MDILHLLVRVEIAVAQDQIASAGAGGILSASSDFGKKGLRISLIMSATELKRRVTRPRATRLRGYFRRLATASTCSRVSGCAPFSSFNALDTLEMLTPDARVTSLMVTDIFANGFKYTSRNPRM
jgi:hypothetical protein